MNNIVKLKYDIAVVGGGPGGIPSAIASARQGMKVILIERNSFLGGAAASGLGFLGFLDRQGKKALGGIAQEIIDRLEEIGGAIGHFRCPVHNSITPISPDLLKIVALKMCEEAGVDVLFNNEIMDVKVDNGRVSKIAVFGKCTRTEIEAKVFIDATGDGDLAYLSGAKYVNGQDDTQIMQPGTLMFTVSDFDLEKLFEYLNDNPEEIGIKEDFAQGYNLEFLRKTRGHCFIGLQNLIKKAKENNDLNIPRDQFIYITTPLDKLLSINTSRVINLNASDPFELSKGLEQGYDQVLQLIRFMNKYVPGFEYAKIAQISTTLGIRETRHFKGIEHLRIEDIYSEKTKKQAIALSAYNIDIHSGTSETIDLTVLKKPFGIPYGCLVPEGLDGLLLSGRIISVDTKVFASVRVMGPCMAIGQAAGIAASISAKEGIPLRDIEPSIIQSILLDQGGIL